jgi:Tfp pilus assembly protein PilX
MRLIAAASRRHLSGDSLHVGHDRLRRRIEHRDDSGQSMVIVVVLLVLLATLAPVMAGQVIRDTPLLNSSASKHAALSAAEAGIQWYRDNLDTYSAYYNYTAANPPSTPDPALTGFCGAGLASTCDLGGTNPPEAFSYTPVASSGCSNPNAQVVCTVALTVTGRGGVRGNYSYVYAEASFSASSVLNDAYYSNFEVLDQNSATIQAIPVSSLTAGGAAVSTPETQYDISYSYVNAASTTINVPPAGSPPPSVWQATCQYDTYSPNTFIDALGTMGVAGLTAYSKSHPYYGPYYGSSQFSFKINGSGVVSSTGNTTVTVQGQPCGVTYDFISGETFSGPVYTNDQLHVCGSPLFNGAPVSLVSGAPSDVPYLYNVPGSVLVTAANSGTNAPYYPSSLIGQYVPGGYTTDPVSGDCGSGDNPSLTHGFALNGTQSLPSLNTSLAEYGTNTPPSGSGTAGCTYVGPTMIELVTSGNTTTMDVWSPLSSNTAVTTPACSSSTGFSTTNPLITGIPLPSDGVVYVQNYTLPTGSPAPVVNDGSFPCFNPYESSQSATSAQCLEGDVYIEGELHGQLTVASAANIMVTRDLTYACADGSGGATTTDPSSVALCSSENTPDILGLSAKYEVLVSHNDPTNGDASTQDCVANHFGDGTGSPTNTPTSTMLTGQPYAATQISGVSTTNASASVTVGSRGFPGVEPGMNVTGTGIAAGTTVVDISGNSLTLSANATATSTVTVTLTFQDKGLQNDPAAVWPTLCDPTNLPVDAAVLALNGSFGVENWDDPPYSNYVNLNGTDLSEFRGPFGIAGSDGYEKNFSYDQRLQYISPPSLLPQSVPLWQVNDYVVCPSSSCPTIH